jgi:hypothetical protein
VIHFSHPSSTASTMGHLQMKNQGTHPMNTKENWKNAVSMKQVLFWHLAGENEENHKNYQDSWCPGQDLNQSPPEYISEEVLLLKPTYSITRIFFFLLGVYLSPSECRWMRIGPLRKPNLTTYHWRTLPSTPSYRQMRSSPPCKPNLTQQPNNIKPYLGHH